MSTHSEPRWLTLHHRATVVDLHAHPSLKVALFHRDLRRRSRAVLAFFWPPSVRTNFPALAEGGVDVLLSAIYAPEKRLLDDIPPLKLLRYIPWPVVRRAWNTLIKPPYFTVTMHLLDELEQRIAQHNQSRGIQRPVAVARSVDELDRLLALGDAAPIAFVHTVEGAHCLQGDTSSENEILTNLETLFARGVAALTLAHFYPNATVMPVFPYPEFALPLLPARRIKRLLRDIELTDGLTAAGRQVVTRMVELGMLIDVSHCTPVARREVYDIVERSGAQSIVFASHVGAYAINPSPYNLEDWEIRWIADHGGVVGVIFMNYWLMPHETKLGLNFISRTIEQFVQAAGGSTAHVAIGTDFDGFTDPPDDLKDAAELPYLTERLLAEMRAPAHSKYTDADVENIIGDNALRMIRAGWKRRDSEA